MKRSKADQEWSQLIRSRDNWTCQRCHKKYPEKWRGLHAAHIFSRRFKKTRHDPENGVAICAGCHWWAHSNPLDFHAWIREWMGEQRYEALEKIARRIRV